MFALVSLLGQTPSTRRVAPAPETFTPAKPKSRNFCAISGLSTNRSIDLRARMARYRFSLVDRKFAREARTAESGGDGKSRNGFQQNANSLVAHLRTSSRFGFSSRFQE